MGRTLKPNQNMTNDRDVQRLSIYYSLCCDDSHICGHTLKIGGARASLTNIIFEHLNYFQTLGALVWKHIKKLNTNHNKL
jgi:hypothetical protein